jgi:IS30 family transposase
MSYAHLNQDERYQIDVYKKMGKTIPEVANELGRNKSTIYREIYRNTGGRGYRAKQAQELADERIKNAAKAIKMTSDLIKKIDEKILINWSPEQISGRLLKTENISISHESIYQHILNDKKQGGDLHTHLRCQKKRRKRYGSKSHDRRGQIPDKVSIEARPSIVDEKIRKGDWEGDLVIGKNHKGALVTLTDRKTKILRMAKVESKEAIVVANKVSVLLKDDTVHTITFDNGKEFSHHKIIAKNTGAKIFFAHPYSSWERGLNENTNGLIRQFFPKGSSFENITNHDVKVAEEMINNRPRKALNFCTPNEIYNGKKRLHRE